jgi:glycosyltransferase involved in cell wall biosynthesis
MKRVLMVAYFFPPLANSGTQRPLKFSTYLPDYGWEPIVLTVGSPPDATSDPELEKEVRPGTRVVRVPMLSDVLSDAATAIFPRSTRKRIASGVSWRLRQHFHVPDLYALWRPTARQAALRVFKDLGFDAVWATGFPWTSLLVGRDVARLTGRPFVADFRDPWTGEDLFNTTARRREIERNHALERSVLAQADAVVMLEDLLTEGLLEVPNDDGRRREVTLIQNGYDEADLNAAMPYEPPPPGIIRIVFTGAWKDRYGLDRLYGVLRKLLTSEPHLANRIQVVAAGFEPGPAAKAGLDGIVIELGRVSHPVAIGLMKTADVLFLPSAEGKRLAYHLPGKLYEYLAVNRPILATGDANGAMARILREAGGAPVLDYRDEEGLTRAVLQAVERGRVTPRPGVPSRLTAFERRTLTGQLAAVLDRAVDRRSKSGGR